MTFIFFPTAKLKVDAVFWGAVKRGPRGTMVPSYIDRVSYFSPIAKTTYLSGIPDLRVGTQPPSCINLDNRLFTTTTSTTSERTL